LIKNVIFDLDGTLLDTSGGVIESVKYTMAKMNFKALSDQEVRYFIGPPLKTAFVSLCGCSENEALTAVNVFRKYYQDGAVFNAKLYSGIEDLCRCLCDIGIRIGVATNKPERFATLLIEKFELKQYIYSVCGADESGKLSKTDLIKLCMEQMGGDLLDTILVGDTENDAIGAKEVGVKFVAVTYGFGYRSVDDTSTYPCIGTIDSPKDLLKIIV